MQETPFEALQRAVQILGLKNQSDLALFLNKKQQTVNSVFVRKGGAPQSWCPKIEAATIAAGDPVYIWQLRPDIFPAPIACAPKKRARATA